MMKNLRWGIFIFLGSFVSAESSTLSVPQQGVVLKQDVVLQQGVVPQQSVVPPGKIVFITGSVSSGKSSMAKVLAEKLNAKSFIFDEYVMPMVLKRFVRKHYGAFAAFFVSTFLMRNFFTTISFLSDKKKYELQIKFYNDLKLGLADEPTSRMYREVKKVAMQGKNVVVESPLHLWEGVDFLKNLTEFEGVDVAYVLVFCPWDDLASRIKQRNSTKDKKTHREFDWAVVNYVYSYNISPNYKGDSFLEHLNGSSVYKVIEKYSQTKYKKRRMCLLSDTRDIAHRAFTENTDYYIYPRFDYNIVVNSRSHNPEQGASAVLDYIQKKRDL